LAGLFWKRPGLSENSYPHEKTRSISIYLRKNMSSYTKRIRKRVVYRRN